MILHQSDSVPSEASARRSRLIGIVALVVTVVVWSAFFLSLRFGARFKLPPVEIAIFRFLPGALFFLPVLITGRKRLLRASPILMILMIVGAGFPYLIVAGYGLRFTPVSDGSTLLPGLVAVFVSLLGFLFYRRLISRHRIFGLALIVIGMIGMLHLSDGDPSLRLSDGYLILIGAAIMWSVFTLAFERSGLQPIDGAVVITFGSLPPLVFFILLRGGPNEILRLEWGSFLWMFVAQGIAVGLVSTIAYTLAIRHLGATIASLAGAITPVFATLLAIPLLGEIPSGLSLAGMALVVTGVVLTNRR